MTGKGSLVEAMQEKVKELTTMYFDVVEGCIRQLAYMADCRIQDVYWESYPGDSFAGRLCAKGCNQYFEITLVWEGYTCTVTQKIKEYGREVGDGH